MEVEIKVSKGAAHVSLDALKEHIKPLLPRLDKAHFISMAMIAKYAAEKRQIKTGDFSAIPAIIEGQPLIGICMIEDNKKCLQFMLPTEFGVDDKVVELILDRSGPVKDGQHRSFQS